MFVDTGFNGGLLLPRSLVAQLGLSSHAQSVARFADGNEATLDAYRVKVFRDDEWQNVVVLASDGEPLMGMRLLLDHELTVQVTDGGAVSIEPLD